MKRIINNRWRKVECASKGVLYVVEIYPRVVCAFNEYNNIVYM